MRFTCVRVRIIPVTWSLHGSAAAHLRLGNLYFPNRGTIFIDLRIHCLGGEWSTWSEDIKPVVPPFSEVLCYDRSGRALPSTSPRN
jgi:hypothetical protein